MTGRIFDIKECSVHDGPGMRTTVFLKGCPLRCIWCHNPEGLSKQPCIMVKHTLCKMCGLCKKGCDHPECSGFSRCIHACPNGAISLSGKDYDHKELAKIILKNKVFFDASAGGVTFSGGEPLMQGEPLLDLLDGVDVHMALETCGCADEELFKKVIARMDYVMFDVKLIDEKEHIKYTGVSNRLILRNLEILRLSGKPYIVRTPLVSGVTDTLDNLSAIKEVVGDSPWETLPYNQLAPTKYERLGKTYKL